MDAMWVNTQPQLWWVTSRQASKTLWVDQATPRAVHAFRMRDTSAYPHQQFLDHGDLVESYRSEYESKTLPKGCIGTKGKGGDYHPTEESGTMAGIGPLVPYSSVRAASRCDRRGRRTHVHGGGSGGMWMYFCPHIGHLWKPQTGHRKNQCTQASRRRKIYNLILAINSSGRMRFDRPIRPRKAFV